MIHNLVTNLNIELIYDETVGLSWQSFSAPVLELVPDVSYHIIINGNEYDLLAEAGTEEGREVTFVGSEAMEEVPFLLQYVYDIETKTYSNFFYFNGELTTTTLNVTVDLDTVNILLYNKKGKTVEYANVDTISTDTVITGAQAVFSRGSLVAPITEPLNMKDGNQIVTAPHGSFVKEITIEKPDTLIPENIKKHVIVGGVEGTFAGDEVEKITELDFSTEYAEAYSETDMTNFKTAENEGRYIRVMYKPGLLSVQYAYLGYYQCVLSNGTYSLVKVDAAVVPTKEEQVVEADEDTVLTKVILPKPENLISENIKKNIDIGGVSGSYIGDGYTHTENALAFTNGETQLIPDTDRLFDKVIIKQPDNLIGENIRKGIIIAGIEGTYTLEGLPTLYSPTGITNLQYSDVTTRPLYGGGSNGAYLYVSNPSTNGAFVKQCQLFIEQTDTITNEDGTTTTVTTNIPVATKDVSGVTSAIYFYADDWKITNLSKTSTLKAQFLGTYFNPSPLKTVTDLNVPDLSIGIGGIALTEISYNGENLTWQYTPEKTYFGQYITNKITPATGFYLPKSIKISLLDTANGDENMLSKGYATYNNTTGAITIQYYRKNVYWGPELSIEAIAPNIPWLQDFSTLPTVSDGVLTVPVPDKNVAKINLWLNDEVVYSIDYATAMVNKEYIPTTITNYGYRFTRNASTGYYKSGNAGVNNSYSLARVTFNFAEETTITIYYINYAEANYDYGYISKVDTALLRSNSADTTGYLFRGYGNNSSSTKTLTVTIPAGSHFIEFKYRKDGSANSGNDSFQFKIYAPQPSITTTVIDLTEIPAFDAPGDYTFQVTGEAEGYTGTDPVTLNFTRTGATVDGETLIIDGTVEEETLAVDYAVVNEETLICNLASATVSGKTLITNDDTVSEETLVTTNVGPNGETIAYDA